MGRHSSPPEVVDDYNHFGIRRVVDPDDEFAREEWLAYGPDDSLVWKEYPGSSGWTTGRRSVADAVLWAYTLGYEDAGDRVSVRPLGS
jgi:hypothetical protein